MKRELRAQRIVGNLSALFVSVYFPRCQVHEALTLSLTSSAFISQHARTIARHAPMYAFSHQPAWVCFTGFSRYDGPCSQLVSQPVYSPAPLAQVLGYQRAAIVIVRDSLEG